MAVTLCVLLWSHPGRETGLIGYEDRVLRLIADHSGTVVQRARTAAGPGEPLEVQLLRFPSEAALAAYMDDARRASMAAERDAAVARTEVYRVDLV